MSDIHDLPEKPEILDKAQKQVALITKQFRRGLITDDERYERVIGAWNDAKDEVQNKLIEHMDIHLIPDFVEVFLELLRIDAFLLGHISDQELLVLDTEAAKNQ